MCQIHNKITAKTSSCKSKGRIFCLLRSESPRSGTKIAYPVNSSAEMPVLHSENFPIPKSKNPYLNSSSSDDEGDTDIDTSNDTEYLPETLKKTCEQHLVQQAELNDLVRDLAYLSLILKFSAPGCKSGTV